MHGVESESGTVTTSTDKDDQFSLVKKDHFIEAPTKKGNKRDPFAADRLNLDIVVLADTPPSQYVGKQLNSIDLKPPNPLQLSLRALRLSIHFAPVMSTCGLAFVSKRFRQGVWYGWISSCLGSAGASFTKWAQWAATRNDMFPESLCDQLATLHSSAPAHSWAYSEASVESSLGLAKGTLKDVFDEFEERPIASGSIAQIHKAVLRGKLVAVKIRHPRVAELIDMDFRLMTRAARIMDWIPGLSWLHVGDSVAQFSHTMAAQAHLQVEAHHLEVLTYNFRSWPQVNFPQPFYASSAIIIETFEPGKIVTAVLDDYDAVAETLSQNAGTTSMIVEEADDDKKHHNAIEEPKAIVDGRDLIPPRMAKFLVTTGVALYLKMLLVDNLMHADLHPGNLMIEMDRLSITLVDAGMVAQLTDKESSAFIGLLASLGEGDGTEAAKFALQFSIENTMGENERKSFVDDMVKMFAERCRGYGTDVDVGHVLRGVLGLIRIHKVRIDANFATLVVNCLCMESLARRVCPTYGILDAAKPLLQSYRQLCYNADGTPRPEARNSKFVKLVLSASYLKKNMYDDQFFRQEKRSNEKKKAAQKVGV
jgi:aarF domain-containing kinase